ncbi:MAG: 30S ribosomal protein S18 [Candidatus Sungbacteria bacterium RIFCSPLOWO2_02_FULL_51_17]|nr:MAG: 30S ribosomal protein S18 [Candidatus Sungbacteria bacterium RIFCSPLOWO2_02_FULL_51_17]
MDSPRACTFCTTNQRIDYKDPEGLRRYMTSQAKISRIRRTALCATHQRKVARAIKRARFLGLLSYTVR